MHPQAPAATASEYSEQKQEPVQPHAARVRHVDPAVYNVVTGINNPKRSKRSGIRTQQRDQRIDTSCEHRASVSMGKLVFVGVPDCFEGELAVGLGRVAAPVSSENEVMVEWLQRVGASSDPSRHGYAWTGSPISSHREIQQALLPREILSASGPANPDRLPHLHTPASSAVPTSRSRTPRATPANQRRSKPHNDDDDDDGSGGEKGDEEDDDDGGGVADDDDDDDNDDDDDKSEDSNNSIASGANTDNARPDSSRPNYP
eukprot:3637507-Pleurochrysis_carterae.AAC.1